MLPTVLCRYTGCYVPLDYTPHYLVPHRTHHSSWWLHWFTNHGPHTRWVTTGRDHTLFTHVDLHLSPLVLYPHTDFTDYTPPLPLWLVGMWDLDTTTPRTHHTFTLPHTQLFYTVPSCGQLVHVTFWTIIFIVFWSPYTTTRSHLYLVLVHHLHTLPAYHTRDLIPDKFPCVYTPARSHGFAGLHTHTLSSYTCCGSFFTPLPHTRPTHSVTFYTHTCDFGCSSITHGLVLVVLIYTLFPPHLYHGYTPTHTFLLHGCYTHTFPTHHTTQPHTCCSHMLSVKWIKFG